MYILKLANKGTLAEKARDHALAKVERQRDGRLLLYFAGNADKSVRGKGERGSETRRRVTIVTKEDGARQ
jgi:hypothetical protein